MECQDDRLRAVGLAADHRDGCNHLLLPSARERRSRGGLRRRFHHDAESALGWPGAPDMSDVKFASWSVSESPITIEYSLILIEEIRHAVAEGFQRLSRGGIE